MKNIKCFLALLIVGVLPFAAGCKNNRPVLEIVNDTGYAAYSLYISDTTTDDWEEELLGKTVLNNGESFSVKLAYPLDVVNRYDVKLIDEDGDEYIRNDVLVRDGSRLYITSNDIVQNATMPVLEVVNNTGYAGYYLHISQTATKDWEEDVLGDDVLINGESIRVTLLYPLNIVNRYDVKLIDKDGDKYIKRNILVREGTRVSITASDYEQ